MIMKATKIYAVMTNEKSIAYVTNLEAVFSTYEKAENHINQLFPNTVNTTREICEFDLDPYENQILNKLNYYFLAAYCKDDFYQIQVDKTSDHIFSQNMNYLDVDGDPTEQEPDFTYYCFAASAEEALTKFKAELLPYMKAHNINLPFAEPQINLNGKGFY
jgi:hypothetical protein